MGRRPCCAKEGTKRGKWTAKEDDILATYVKAHGEGKWREVPQKAGLHRCGKGCRLRWMNYLRPNIKRGNISYDEEDLIVRLHKLLGKKWSLIAGRLPGRTDNEIKNYWNSNLGRRVVTGDGGSRVLKAPDTGSHATLVASRSCETGHTGAVPRAGPDSASAAASAALVSPLVGRQDKPCFSGDGGGDWMDDVRTLASFLESDEEWLSCQMT